MLIAGLRRWPPFAVVVCISLAAVLAPRNCAAETRKMEVTAYCRCGMCNSYTYGSWKFLKLDIWNRYVCAGPDKGMRYTGHTSSGTRLHEVQPGLFSVDSARRPWMIPVRIAAFPWMLLPRAGTVAADTKYYPYGTRMYVPGYGWGVVEDTGGDIKGPNRLDVYYWSHKRTLEFGRRHVNVTIKR